MNKMIAMVLVALIVVIISALVVAPKRHVSLVDATVECRNGFKWIITRDGKAIEWITANGTKPPC